MEDISTTQIHTAPSPIGSTGGESTLIAKTFQGLEPLLAQELTELGATDIQIGRRMVTFTGDKEMMYRANFCLRTAIRILKPIKQFKAKSADDVYNAVKNIDWSEYLSPQTTFAVDSVVFSNEFHHSKFVAYKVKDAIADQFRERTGSRPNVSVSNPDIQLHIHVSDNDATLALDSSGESLHRRGYRQETVAAPLNEVLAAGIILMTGWHGESDFLDPFCGSGTLCIEAALIARGIAPGVFRQGYAFEKWPDFDRELLERIYNDDSNERDFEHHIYGRDIDAKAVGIALRNVKAAGLSKDISIEMADFTKCPLFPSEDEQTKALIITNPPYGERISSPDLLGLYRTIGQKLKREFTGGEAWILSYCANTSSSTDALTNIAQQEAASRPMPNAVRWQKRSVSSPVVTTPVMMTAPTALCTTALTNTAVKRMETAVVATKTAEISSEANTASTATNVGNDAMIAIKEVTAVVEKAAPSSGVTSAPKVATALHVRKPAAASSEVVMKTNPSTNIHQESRPVRAGILVCGPARA